MEMKKIGITTSQMIMVDPSLCGNKKTSVNTSYVRSIQETGALPILIPCICSRAEMEQYVAMCDGFLLTGGMDIAPILYGAMPQHCGTFDYEVDVCLLEFVKLALESHKPILGICRGMQMVNIALGGTLIQDIPSQSSIDHAFDYDGNIVHGIQLERNGEFQKLFEQDSLLVNSLHHQAIDTLGKGLKVEALAPDGVIEGISGDHLLGVQWHPELMGKIDPLMKRLFAWLCND